MPMKPFPWKCGTCRERALAPAVIDYREEVEHDARAYTISIPGLRVLKCANCGALVLDDDANQQVSDALRREAGLLTPSQIRQNREALGLTQKQLANYLQVGESTLSRWETGGQIQQRSLDRFLRLFFRLPEARYLLRELGDDCPDCRQLAALAGRTAAEDTRVTEKPQVSEITIQSAFPTLPPEALNNTLAPLSGADSLASLVSDPRRESLWQKLAPLLMKQADTPLLSALPGLNYVKEQPIARSGLKTGPKNALESEGHTRWANVLDKTITQLLEIRNMGAGRMKNFLTCAARTSAEAQGRSPSLSLPNAAEHKPLGLLLEELLDSLDKRNREVFFQRIPYDAHRTQKELADHLGITRQRVQQIQESVGKQIREALLEQRFLPISWRASTLRTLLGSAVPPAREHFHQAMTRITRDLPESKRKEMGDLFLWLAGPYERDASTGWLAVGQMPGPETARDFCDAFGGVDVACLEDRLNQLGVVPALHRLWMEEIAKICEVEGHFLLWSGTVIDKAERILHLWHQPATVEEMVEAIKEEHDTRATRDRLFQDRRFVRVDMDRFALRAWGCKEYPGIAEAIAQEIDRGGGSANVEGLVATLVSQVSEFHLREVSVRVYLKAPVFVIQGDTIRRRTDQDPYGILPPVTNAPGCYLLEPDALTWRVQVTPDLLRGSGRSMPAPLAGWLGVSPGEQRSFQCDSNEVKVSWPEKAPSPNLGSIKPCLERAACVHGDQVLLRFQREEGTLRLSRIDRAGDEGAAGLQLVSLLTGIPLEGDVQLFLDALGRAVGVAGTATAVKEALCCRGEADLAELIPGA